MTAASSEQRPSALENLRVVPPMGAYLRQVWDRRWFVIKVPWEEIRAETATTRLGWAWQFLNPLLLLLVYWVLFSAGLRAGRSVEHFVTYLSIGIFFFRFSEQSAHRGARAVLGNMPLVMSVRFPRLILPLSEVLAALLYLALGLLAVVTIAVLDGAYPSLRWLGVIPALALQTAFNVGVAGFLARATFHLHDMQHLTQHVFRVLFYVSGVLFPVEAFFSDRWVPFFVANPFFAYVSLHRWAMLGIEPPTGTVISAVAWALVALVGGVWFFRRGELRYGRHEF